MRYISSRRQDLGVHSSTRRSAGRAAVDPRQQQAPAAGSPPPSSRSASGDEEASARTAGPAGAFEPQAASPARQKMFNRIAPVYDELNNKLSFGQHWIWKRMTVKWSGAKRKDRVLDVCCGSGDLALLLAEVVGPDGQVVGLDYAPEMLDDAALRAEECVRRSARPAVQIRWVQGDALDLPFPDAHFDALTMGYGLRNVVDRPQALRELHRVLKPGAKAAVLDFNNSTNPVVDQIQAAFLEQLVVPEARKYGLEDEYEYLRPSIKAFATGPEQEQMALAAGFSKATHFEISFGLMGVLVATKAT